MGRGRLHHDRLVRRQQLRTWRRGRRHHTTGDTTIAGSEISGNTAPDGGAAGAWISGSGTIDRTIISNNTAGGSDATGGLFTDSDELHLTNTTVSGNVAQGDGSAGGIDATGTLYLDRVTVDNNQGGDTGAGGILEDEYTRPAKLHY